MASAHRRQVRIIVWVHPSHDLTNTERFHLRSVQRPAPTRSASAPPILGRRPLKSLPRPTSRLQRLRDGARNWLTRRNHDLRQGIDRTRNWLRHSQNPRRTLISVAAAVFMVYITVNSAAYVYQSPLPILVQYDARYQAPNTWLYAHSPDQIFGLPEPLWPGAILPPKDLEKLFRRHLVMWHPDSHNKHRNASGSSPPYQEFHSISRRFYNAKEQFYQRLPYGFYFQSPNMTLPDNDVAPFFASDCVCSISRAATSAARHALTPYWRHTLPPQTVKDLETYCPCSMGKALRRWWHHLMMEMPPLTTDYYDDAPLFIRLWMTGSPDGIIGSDWELPPDERKRGVEKGWLPKHCTDEEWVQGKRARNKQMEEEYPSLRYKRPSFLRWVFESLSTDIWALLTGNGGYLME